MSEYENYMDSDMLEIDLLKIIKALWKKLWLIVLVAAVFGGTAFVYRNSTYVPSYMATTTMYASYVSNQDLDFGNNSGVISQDNLTSSRSMVDTAIAVLSTRMVQEEVIAAANLSIPYTKLSDMIVAEGINKTEVFTISVTGTKPEEIALIANTIAEILPQKVAMINANGTVRIIDTALVPTSPISSNSSVKDAIVFAVLGGMLVCGVVAVKEIYIDWKAAKEKINNNKSN